MAEPLHQVLRPQAPAEPAPRQARRPALYADFLAEDVPPGPAAPSFPTLRLALGALLRFVGIASLVAAACLIFWNAR